MGINAMLCYVMLYPELSLLMFQTIGPRPLGPKEIDGLLMPPGKAYTMLTGYLITG